MLAQVLGTVHTNVVIATNEAASLRHLPDQLLRPLLHLELESEPLAGCPADDSDHLVGCVVDAV